jgi:hypothetical protein
LGFVGFYESKFRYLWVLAALFCFARAAEAISWTPLDYPGAKETYITGIDGDTPVGYYSTISSYNNRVINPHGFVYDGQTWTTLDCPRRLESSLAIDFTMIEGIDNGIIVGNCHVTNISRNNYYERQSGFIYDGQTWSLLNYPGASNTYAQAIDGSNIAGYYTDATGYHGFVYDGTTWTTLLYPFNNYYGLVPRIVGISGNKVAIYDLINYDGVIYNLDSQTWNTIEFPGEKDFTRVLAIDGSNIIGFHGEGMERPGYYFLYNGTSWTSFDRFISPRFGDVITDIDGDNIVGYYRDATGVHGFIAAIPEPATLALLAFGGLLLRKKKL